MGTACLRRQKHVQFSDSVNVQSIPPRSMVRDPLLYWPEPFFDPDLEENDWDHFEPYAADPGYWDGTNAAGEKPVGHSSGAKARKRSPVPKARGKPGRGIPGRGSSESGHAKPTKQTAEKFETARGAPIKPTNQPKGKGDSGKKSSTVSPTSSAVVGSNVKEGENSSIQKGQTTKKTYLPRVSETERNGRLPPETLPHNQAPSKIDKKNSKLNDSYNSEANKNVTASLSKGVLKSPGNMNELGRAPASNKGISGNKLERAECNLHMTQRIPNVEKTNSKSKNTYSKETVKESLRKTDKISFREETQPEKISNQVHKGRNVTHTSPAVYTSMGKAARKRIGDNVIATPEEVDRKPIHENKRNSLIGPSKQGRRRKHPASPRSRSSQSKSFEERRHVQEETRDKSATEGLKNPRPSYHDDSASRRKVPPVRDTLPDGKSTLGSGSTSHERYGGQTANVVRMRVFADSYASIYTPQQARSRQGMNRPGSGSPRLNVRYNRGPRATRQRSSTSRSKRMR